LETRRRTKRGLLAKKAVRPEKGQRTPGGREKKKINVRSKGNVSLSGPPRQKKSTKTPR